MAEEETTVDTRTGDAEITGDSGGTDETASTTGAGGSSDMTVAQLRDWLRNWVAEVTGQPVSQISDDRPMEEFGLSSRDAVALSGEIIYLVTKFRQVQVADDLEGCNAAFPASLDFNFLLVLGLPLHDRIDNTHRIPALGLQDR